MFNAWACYVVHGHQPRPTSDPLMQQVSSPESSVRAQTRKFFLRFSIFMLANLKK